MNPTQKTLVYVALAAASVGLAVGVDYATRPVEVTGYEDVGAYFYPHEEDVQRPAFEDPTAAKGLRLAVYDDERQVLDTFEVAYRDGTWVLPDFHDYPVDAGTQLAKTLSEVAGVRREALQTRRDTDHAELGVLDPLASDTYTEQGHGERITVTDENEQVLVDLIVGDRVEDAETENLRYVRRADQDEVYRAVVDVDVSTALTDWINPDLLVLDPQNDLEGLRPEDLDEDAEDEPAAEDEEPAKIVRATVEPPLRENGEPAGEPLALERETATADWELAGLDEETEELQTSPVSSLVSTLGRLRIVGVRPKPEYLGPNLQLTEEFRQLDPLSQRAAVSEIRRSLLGKGFGISQVEGTEQLQLESTSGGVVAGTDKGVVYELFFGDEVSGTDRQLQTGEEAADTGSGTAEERKGRYLAIRVDFDESLVPGKPAKPEPPQKPEPEESPKPEEKPESEVKPEPSEDAESEAASEKDAETEEQPQPAADGESDGEEETPADANADENSDGEEKPEADADSDPAEEPEAGGKEGSDQTDGKSADGSEDADSAKPDADETADPDAAFAAAQQAYERELAGYESAVKEYEAKIARGRERAEKLNRRFAKWYYVISAADYDKLSLTRDEVVTEKEPEESPEPQPMPGDAEPDEPQPSDDAPKPDAPKPDEPKPDEPKSDEPVKEEPVKEEPASDASKTETPDDSAKEPAAETSAKDEAAKEESPPEPSKPDGDAAKPAESTDS